MAAALYCNWLCLVARFTKTRCTRNREPNSKQRTEPISIFKHNTCEWRYLSNENITIWKNIVLFCYSYSHQKMFHLISIALRKERSRIVLFTWKKGNKVLVLGLGSGYDKAFSLLWTLKLVSGNIFNRDLQVWGSKRLGCHADLCTAGVAAEVNLRITHAALKPKADVTRSSN